MRKLERLDIGNGHPGSLISSTLVIKLNVLIPRFAFSSA